LPDGDDPDSYIRTHGREVFEEKIVTAIPMSDVLIGELTRKTGDLDSLEGKSKLASLFKPLVVRVKAPMMRKLLTERVSSLTGLSINDLGDEESLKTQNPSRRSPNDRDALVTSSSRASSAPSVLQHLIEMLIIFPEVMGDEDSKQLNEVRPNLQKNFSSLQFDVLAEILRLVNQQLSQSEIIDRVRSTEYEALVVRAVKLANIRYQEGKVEIESVKSEYEQAWEQLHRLSRLNLQEELLSKGSVSSMSIEDKARYRSLMQAKPETKSD
jgi:DNA primase